jgi:hypothetical protein
MRKISVSVLLLAAVIVTAFLIPRPSINRIVNGNLLTQCPNQRPPVSPEPESQNVSQREQFAVILANPGQTATLCIGYTANGFTNSATLQLQSQAVAANTTVFTRSISVTTQPSGSIVAPPANDCGLSPCGLSVAYAVYTITITYATPKVSTYWSSQGCVLRLSLWATPHLRSTRRSLTGDKFLLVQQAHIRPLSLV